jgi:hypothetical protein
MGKEARSNLKTDGRSASSGSWSRMRSIREPHLVGGGVEVGPPGEGDAHHRLALAEVEVISSTPAMAATASSTGRVTRSSTSCGPTFG